MQKTSLKKVLTRQIALFVIAMMALVLSTVAVMMTNALKREVENSLIAETVHIEETLETHLAFQKENISGLAKNHFVTNSLVDISGRDLYLPKLIDGFLAARQVAAITVVDFEGKVIRSSMELPPDYLLTTRLLSSLEAGRSVLELSAQRQRIIFIEPIFYYQTPQGAVIMEIDLGVIVAQAVSHRPNLYYRLLGQEKVILEKRASQGDYLTVSHTFSPNLKYLQQLGLSLEIGTLKSSYLGLVGKIIAQLSLLAFIFITLSLLLAAKIADNIAKPILTLRERVRSRDIFADKAYGPLGTNDELEELAEAFEQRTMRLRKEMEEREKAENKTILAFERFKTVMDGIDALVYVADMETYEVLFINKYGRNNWGEVTGETCWEKLQSGQDGPCPFCTNDKLLDSNGQSTGVFVWEIQNTANQKWYQCRDQAIRWTDERLVRMEIAVDITRQKETEKALAAEKESLAVTLRSIGDGVITTDTSGNVVLLNKVAENLTGWSNEEAVGRPLLKVFHIINEQTREICENPVTKVISSGLNVELANHTVLIARDGTELSIADSGAPILDAKSNIIGVVLVFRDVSERIKTEKELLKAKKIESIGVLAGGIAHDFNNILAALLGNINLALFDKDLKDETKELLTEAEKASFRAKALTQQLLTFSKGGDPVKEVSSLDHVIQDSANFVLHGDKVACHYSFPEDLWLVDIDKGQMSQVIQNIVLNASHAMPEGGTIKITCENVSFGDDSNPPALQKGRFVKICIQDSGIGMPESVAEKIFDPYFSTKEEGSGLGLAISHSIIIKHHGDILVESSPGSGTLFTIYIPASEKTKIQEQGPLIENKASSQANILIMDDDEMVGIVAQKMFVSLGHKAVLVADGEKAMKLYHESMNADKKFDLVIMDLTIPGGMGGQEAVREVLNIDPEAKVIVSSGYSNDPIMANYEEYGFCSAIVKPFNLSDLKKVIEQVMN